MFKGGAGPRAKKEREGEGGMERCIMSYITTLPVADVVAVCSPEALGVGERRGCLGHRCL